MISQRLQRVSLQQLQPVLLTLTGGYRLLYPSALEINRKLFVNGLNLQMSFSPIFCVIYLFACLSMASNLGKGLYVFPGSDNCTYSYSLPCICLLQTEKNMMQSSEIGLQSSHNIFPSNSLSFPTLLVFLFWVSLCFILLFLTSQLPCRSGPFLWWPWLIFTSFRRILQRTQFLFTTEILQDFVNFLSSLWINTNLTTAALC